jgi:anti-anti-sigma factor
MPIRCDEYNQVCVITVEGDLAGDAPPQLRHQAEQRIESKQIVDFIVDLEKCEFMDSEGLETLLWLKRKCDDLFGQVKLAAPTDNCRKILEITRLEHRFESQRDLAAALKMMR